MEFYMNYKIVFSIIITTVFGCFHTFFVPWIWGYLVPINSLADWLLIGSASNDFYRIALYVHDYIINLILSVPLALVIYFLKPKRQVLYLGIALLTSFITYMLLVSGTLNIFSWSFIFNQWVGALFMVPIILFAINRVSDNDSI